MTFALAKKSGACSESKNSSPRNGFTQDQTNWTKINSAFSDSSGTQRVISRRVTHAPYKAPEIISRRVTHAPYRAPEIVGRLGQAPYEFRVLRSE